MSLTLEERLAERREMQDVTAAERMRNALGVPRLRSFLPVHSVAAVGHASGYVALRDEQNRAWAAESVARGVSHARAGNTTVALAAYKHALELDQTHADAYVARGAALANTGKLDDAIADLEKAIHYAPHHPNALRYLEATRARLQRREPSKSPPLAPGVHDCQRPPPSLHGTVRAAAATDVNNRSSTQSSVGMCPTSASAPEACAGRDRHVGSSVGGNGSTTIANARAAALAKVTETLKRMQESNEAAATEERGVKEPKRRKSKEHKRRRSSHGDPLSTAERSSRRNGANDDEGSSKKGRKHSSKDDRRRSRSHHHKRTRRSEPMPEASDAADGHGKPEGSESSASSSSSSSPKQGDT